MKEKVENCAWKFSSFSISPVGSTKASIPTTKKKDSIRNNFG